MREIIYLTLAALSLLSVSAAVSVGGVPGKQGQSRTAGPSLFSLRLRTRQDVAVREEKVDWDATKTAVIVCDMWDKHWCKGATRRVTEIAPHINALLKTAREKGALIIHAPSACMGAYKDHPARKRATGAKADDAPKFLRKGAVKLDAERDAVWPIDQKDGGCDCQPVCKQGQPWTRQIATIKIADADAITDSGVETWNLLAARKIDNVLLTGVHTNMCVIGRPFGLRNLKRAGKNVVLVRDLTDTMYNSRRRPKVSHFRGTELIVSYIEQFVCPTAISTDITAAAPSQFSSDKRPHIVFLLGEREYRTTDTVPAFAEAHLAPTGFRCTYIHAASHDDATRKHDFLGFEAVRSADLLFVSIRRRGLKPEQLDLIRAHLDAGKPLVGIRTASHAFHTRGKHPKGYTEWEAFDSAVLGGNYHGHHGPKHQPKITLAAGAGDHPILRGVKPFVSAGSLYEVRPLVKGATPLLIGTIPEAEPEPVAWTHTYKRARIFYTSLGHWDDFKDPHFLRLLTNAIRWAAESSIVSPKPPDLSREIRRRIPAEDIAWLREATKKQLRGCRVKGSGGVWLHTPDGVGNYRALWTRDFQYMVEYAGDLLDPKEIKASILYLLAGQRDDGCIPDRVNVAGVAVYGPGPEPGVRGGPLADHALDNGAFMAKLVCTYVSLTGDPKFFRQVEPAIRKGLDHTRRAANGLVYNPPDAPLCPYGFTDNIAKTGHLLFCSVLYYDACVQMERLCRQAKCGDPKEYRRRAALIRKNLRLLWNDDAGMFWAADRDCKQIDIWGSALAVHVGCATDAQADRVADYLVAHYDKIVQRGQVRHLPAKETWQRFMPRRSPKPGTYQNGAFWATPVAWVAPTIARRNPDLAVKMVRDVIADFRRHGIMECVNGDYHAVPKYVASATNMYGLLREGL